MIATNGLLVVVGTYKLSWFRWTPRIHSLITIYDIMGFALSTLPLPAAVRDTSKYDNCGILGCAKLEATPKGEEDSALDGFLHFSRTQLIKKESRKWGNKIEYLIHSFRPQNVNCDTVFYFKRTVHSSRPLQPGTHSSQVLSEMQSELLLFCSREVLHRRECGNPPTTTRLLEYMINIPSGSKSRVTPYSFSIV